MIRALVSMSLAAGSAASVMTQEQAHDVLRENVKSYQSVGVGRSLCSENTCCNVTATESCSLAAMPRDETTLVLPGGDTRCIYSYSTPFAFQVIPGDKDKVLLYFQGGGACWDETSTKAGLCTSDSSPQGPNGVFDRSNTKNAFKDHTIVHVLYCSGDIFGGNVVRDYTDKDGVPIVQKGFHNAESALDWVVNQQGAGNLDTLSELVVMGCSAGSIGAQLWGNQAVTRLKWTEAAVIPDSYAGVFPEGSQGPLIKGYGMCTVSEGFINAENQAKCEAETLTLQDINSEFIAATPEVPFSFIQSKTDIVQISFYSSIAFSMNMSAAITPAQFYNDVNTIFEGYNSNPNFLTYLVDGDQHCFTPSNLYYSADAISADDNGATATQEMMYQWAGHFPLDNAGTEKTICEGTVEASGLKAVNSQTYCSADLVPKSFTEDWSA